MRRIALIPLAAALVLASASSAALHLQPVRRSFGEVAVPRVRPGNVTIPSGQKSGRLTVLVDLRLPPLAAYHASLFSATGSQRLNVAGRSSRAYLAQLSRGQRAAAAQLRRAIPQARITRRYRIVLDGFAVNLPARKLPRLASLSSVTKIYPSLRYTLDLNTSPSIINVPAFWSATGDRGEGVKIGIVDDGIDPTNSFFNPSGFSYPAGFPKGGRKWTTPKVIVARAFPGPGSGRQGRLALVRTASFHGTHVAGIAAGETGTTAPAGPDHPAVSGLSGIAPRAWLGNYRVFNTPTPIGYDAFTPQIVAAFEAAVGDGMNVINFSGGGPQTDPQTDALVEVVRNVAAAGVVPVIAAGNDRDEFGLGSVGSPGTAPDAIAVAAVSNLHVFAPPLTVQSPGAPPTVTKIPTQPAGELPSTWSTVNQNIVDVGTLAGTQGQPVDRHLCGPANDPNGPAGNLPPSASLAGAIALVFRGFCSFASKALRAHDAGAIGMVLVDNRAGEANGIPIRFIDFPMAMIADLDGANLRDYLDAHGGKAPIRIGSSIEEIATGRSGIVTSFSSAGPTDFGHLLKPDVAAPGGQIISSTLPEFAGSPFAVFDGTSMATPHVTGAAALLVQAHPGWSAAEIKSALMSTAGAAWGNTQRTQEASVLLEGAGLVNVNAASDPKIFTRPSSVSLGDIHSSSATGRASTLVSLVDAGGGGGVWTMTLQPQSASTGATIDIPGSVTIAPGGTVDFPVAAQVDAGAPAGDDYGFVVLHHGTTVRRIPYAFFVTQAKLAGLSEQPIKRLQTGDTRGGTSHVNVYRFPGDPFGAPPSYTGVGMDETGAEHVYVMHVNVPVANAGAAVIGETPNSIVEPWFLGSKDENDVQGYPGTPVNVNALSLGFHLDVGAAGAVFPRVGRYYVSVDSGRDLFTGHSFAGSYILRSWINDVTPPKVRILTRRVTAGRPLLAAIVTDSGSGVDPLSLVIAYRNILLGAALYDPFSGLALFPIPSQAPTIPSGKTSAVVVAADFQEAKNVDQVGANILPNTTFRTLKFRGVAGATVSWLLPRLHACVARSQTLAVSASAPRRITGVRFLDGRKRIAFARRGAAGLYVAAWSTGKATPGRHVLRAVLVERGGKTAAARIAVRVCRNK
ncbi:MAG: S8 family serine peptidase [Gaiellaceae bacterium]